jgi:SAM-dependent MidA family methyltransferase
MIHLPPPDISAKETSEKLTQHIQKEIAQSGPINFARYMDLALYTPRLGYYSAGAQKFGEAGDFITAPELSPLFGQCIAKQIADVLDSALGGGDILEFGAGSGRLAIDILKQLATLNFLPQHYYILEVSASLKARQKTLILAELPELFERVVWLDALPEYFSGVILANEVLDAMPVHRFRQNKSMLTESFIYPTPSKAMAVDSEGEFVERFDKASDTVQEAVDALRIVFDENYTTEISTIIPAWINSLSVCLKQGLILLIDYGFVRKEFYHPDRHMGTLMCHYRHHSHQDIFLYPGLQDITAHVDFTAVAEAALPLGLNVMGYTTQAHFLMGCGLIEISQQDSFSSHKEGYAVVADGASPAPSNPMGTDIRKSYQTAQQIKRLVLPSEMGELFKVMALGKNITMPLSGFTLQDMREKL